MYTQNVLRNRSTQLTNEELKVLEGAVAHTQYFAAGSIIVREGMPVPCSTLLVEGIMTRHVDSPYGTRHMVAVHVPGDFVDLHAYVLKKLDHDVGALTDVTVAIVPHSELEKIQEEHLSLAKRLWFMTLLDSAMHRHWIYRLSSLTAVQRVAHFLCEMNARLLAIESSTGTSFFLPMTQRDIGEVCGLTNVHVNRVLRELKQNGLCNIHAFNVHITDLKGLTLKAMFDPDYLYLNRHTAARAAGQV